LATQPKKNIGCFTADFRQNRVAVGGKAFNAEYLEVDTEFLFAKIEEFKEQGCTLFYQEV
jgi:hypothetical protein